MLMTVTYTPVPGTRLPNGALVIAKREPTNGNLNRGWVVLALASSEDDYEYATWLVSALDGEAFWGDYHHHDLEAAVESFKER